ncbi:FIST signal transduction protein [Roseateles koreensis]|uniref:FIST N-terminal domain-containing protein n=1 Tax=Roseateles koreensis TaxID=2987526 RepID=A0ABT5KXI2_9BURK|nr:FIST N-terminal domain-containing protein [Roseateles koreensis]MDC8787058.1 FIST N-terminal domain-containing protein [Roseateles koreensis]
MKIAQVVLHPGASIGESLAPLQAIAPQLLLAFGAADLLQTLSPLLLETFSQATVAGCSTAGEISDQGMSDGTCVVTAVHFEHSTLVQAGTRLISMADSLAAGRRLAVQLPRAGLRAVLLFGQGVNVNGSALIQGLAENLDAHVPITGGLAGDAAAFKQTWVLGQTGLRDDQLICIGLYGDALSFSHASFGGWSAFGPARRVTRCDHNILYELDGEPALDVYKRYLGAYAQDLPASGLLFPFAMLGSDHTEVGLIRTILGVDDKVGSLTLAGEIDPEGYLRLMHASTDALVDGAETAALNTLRGQPAPWEGPGDALALLVSCVGRKLVMGDRVDEEVEAVAEVFGPHTVVAGFYSNGEISPRVALPSVASADAPDPARNCLLHNQTMTITHLAEFQANAPVRQALVD